MKASRRTADLPPDTVLHCQRTAKHRSALNEPHWLTSHTKTTMRKICEVINAANGKTVKVYRNAEYDEYVVKPCPSKGCDWYFTDDKQDAIDTANAMIGVPTER